MKKPETVAAVHTYTHTGNLINNEKSMKNALLVIHIKDR